ncbi:MAG: hypothetical protein ACOC4J_06765, partial [Bacteroidota bacterium]
FLGANIIYFTIECNLVLDVIKDYKDNAELKFMLARLYNAGVKVKSLIEHFGYSYPTYKQWGEALKSGDAEKIYLAFSSQGGNKKLTPDIILFIIHDFSHVYPRNKSSYSKEIREDIKDVYGIDISAECIRPTLKMLKEKYHSKEGLTEEAKKIYKSYLQ